MGIELLLGLLTHLDDLVTGELEVGDVHCITSHEIAVQNAKNGLVSNDKEIVLLTFELENDGFETDSQVMVRLQNVSLWTLV